VNTALKVLWIMFCFMPLPLILTYNLHMDAGVVFVLTIFITLFPLYLYSKIEHRQWLPRYERWKKIATEMGLEESDSYSIVEGYYRKHHVKIDEIDIANGDESEDSQVLKTRYIVEFENPKPVLMYLKKHFSFPIRNVLSKDYHDIKIGKGEFDEEFVIKGNNESDIKEILDPSIRSKIINARNTLYEVYIGYTKNYLSGREIEAQNTATYIDSRSLYWTKANAERFQMIIDTLINIVEKIEK